MDERTTHDDDMLEDMNNDLEDDLENDDPTPADTDDDKSEDEPKKTDREAVRLKQREVWLKEIKSGKRKIEDMPANLEWLKKDIKKELDGKAQDDDLDSKIQNVLTEREAKQEFDLLVDDLQGADISAEQEAQLRQEYEDIISEYSNPSWAQRRKSLILARRLAGLKDGTSELRDRRRRGMSLPPLGGRKRSTVQKDQMTEIEKKLSGGLPPGFKA